MNNNSSSLDIGQVIIPILGDLYKCGKSYIQNLVKSGMYNVIKYETTLELFDKKGKSATLSKIEEVRFLQNNIIAFQDQAWGDGKILLGYQCSPGFPVDFYRSGHKTYILISLRDVKQKDDRTTFNIQWKIKDGFRKKNGFWATDVNHYTQVIKTNIIFPEERPPLRLSIIESNCQKTKELSRDSLTQLPDKRWQATWKKHDPKVHEHYILKWEW